MAKIIGNILVGDSRKSTASMIQPTSGAGVGFKKMTYQAKNLATRLRALTAAGNERAAYLWLPAERRYFRRLDSLINITGIEAKNKTLAAMRKSESEEG
jgi:hypothetical protein